MFHIPYFIQECPVCGRPLHIRVEYLGRGLACQHCGGRFTASDAAISQHVVRGENPLLARADELLRLSSRRLDGSPSTATS